MTEPKYYIGQLVQMYEYCESGCCGQDVLAKGRCGVVTAFRETDKWLHSRIEYDVQLNDGEKVTRPESDFTKPDPEPLRGWERKEIMSGLECGDIQGSLGRAVQRLLDLYDHLETQAQDRARKTACSR